MKYFNLFILAALLLSCTKKEVSIEIEETKCKNFSITHEESEFIKDATCGSDISSQLKVSGTYDGDDECFHKLKVNPQFFDASGAEISPTSYDALYDSANTDLIKSGGDFTYYFDYNMNQADFDRLSYVQLNYFSENELQTPSNTVGARINLSCVPIDAPTQFENTINLPKDEITYIDVVFSDHAAEDGDIISLNVNGNWVLENTFITNAGNTYSIPVSIGSNWFLVYAVNEGSSSPNTVTIEVKTGNTQHDKSFAFNMNTAESKAFKINVIN